MTTFVERLEARYNENPAKVAIQLQAAGRPDRAISYADLLREASAYADALCREGIQPGEVVILISGGQSDEVSEEALGEEVRRMRDEGATQRQIVEWLISRHGAPRNLAYKLAHQP